LSPPASLAEGMISLRRKAMAWQECKVNRGATHQNEDGFGFGGIPF